MSRLSRIGLPLSIVSRTASRRECFCTCRAKSIEIPRPLVPAQRGPGRLRLARRVDGSIHVVNVALGHLGQHFACRRIAGRLVLAAHRLHPRAANELLKPAMVPLEPRHRFFRILRRGSVLHGVELFRYAHSVSLDFPAKM